jgi:hypothetical protein
MRPFENETRDFCVYENLRKTRIKLYNTLDFPVLLYGSETWTVKARDARRITATEMKYNNNNNY